MATSMKSHRKTKELLIYVAHRLGHRPNYGSTLLNKALYFIDNISYLKSGKPISEFSYIKQEWGPTPEPSLFLSIRDQLIKSGDVVINESDYFGRIQKKVIPLREPHIDSFTKEEIVLMDEVLAGMAEWNGTEASEFSHRFPAWQAATNAEPLPFYTFLLSTKTPAPVDIEWAKSELKSVQGHSF